MSDNLGAIDGDVEFNFGHARTLKSAFTNAASLLETQASSRSSLVTTAREEFRGYFEELFASNARTAASDAEDIATALRNAAGFVEDLAQKAREENERRRLAREFIAEQQHLKDKFGALKDFHDSVMGEPEPPVGPPSDPINTSAQTPVNTPRKTPNPSPGSGNGGGGTTSAIPENLRAFSTGLEPLDTEVKGKKTSLDTAYADFQGSCKYGSLDAAGAIGAIDTWLEKNAQDITWAIYSLMPSRMLVPPLVTL